MYGFIDASGGSFGSTFVTKSNQGINYRIGVWGPGMQGKSSNLREFRNGVDAIEHEGEQGCLAGTEVFMIGDNMVREVTYYWGSSMDKLLHAEGTNGVSRGNMTEGVMQEADMMELVPLNKMATEASPALCNWIMSWAHRETEFLSAEGWYEHGHDIIG
eukprot:3478585-Ditylum_brightwellii.AAC.1